MILLNPTSEAHSPGACPKCQAPLTVQDWLTPGMRPLWQVACGACGFEGYVDMPTGQALYESCALEKHTGQIVKGQGWFAEWLQQAYQQRAADPKPKIETVRRQEIKQPLLLNCLDALYGHALLKLLNYQRLQALHPQAQIIPLIQPCLLWLLPEEVPGYMCIHLPLKKGTAWSETINQAIREEWGPAPMLAQTVPQPETSGIDIATFTQTQPFAYNDPTAWQAPWQVTVVWREDRLWLGPDWLSDLLSRAMKKLPAIGQRLLRGWQQRRYVALLAKVRRQLGEEVRVAIAGPGQPGGLPGWIQEARSLDFSDQQERRWCQLYQQSHMVIGIHGSNMLLPTAHAGGSVILMPKNRWGNRSQDMWVAPGESSRATLLRHQLLSLDTPSASVATVVTECLKSQARIMTRMLMPWNGGADQEPLAGASPIGLKPEDAAAAAAKTSQSPAA